MTTESRILFIIPPSCTAWRDAEHYGIWMQAGENPEAKRFIEDLELSKLAINGEEAQLQYENELWEWARKAIAYQAGVRQ